MNTALMAIYIATTITTLARPQFLQGYGTVVSHPMAVSDEELGLLIGKKVSGQMPNPNPHPHPHPHPHLHPNPNPDTDPNPNPNPTQAFLEAAAKHKDVSKTVKNFIYKVRVGQRTFRSYRYELHAP